MIASTAKKLLQIIKSKFSEYQFFGKLSFISSKWWYNTIADPELSNIFEAYEGYVSIDELSDRVDNIDGIMDSFHAKEDLYTSFKRVTTNNGEIIDSLEGYMQYTDISQDKLVELFTHKDVFDIFTSRKERNKLINSLNSEQQLDLIDYFIKNESDELLTLLSNISNNNLEALFALYPHNTNILKYIELRGMRGTKRKN